MNYIVIEGNIGAGKTSLTKKIAEEYNAKLILEQFSDNPFLPKFYDNPEKYSFPLELSFLAERYNQLNNELNTKDIFKTFNIADYYFIKSLIFAQNTLSSDEYNLYRQIFNIIYKSLPIPDLFVFLHLPTEQLLKNIITRGRDYEKSISAEYLDKINKGYFDFFKQSKEMKILIIDSQNIDFVNNTTHYKQITEKILNTKYEYGITHIHF